MNPEKILLIQLRRVGDVIFTLPVIGALRRHFPQAKIDFLTEKPSDQMVRLSPGLSECLVYEKDRPVHWIREIRSRKYDWVLDFHSNGRTLFLSLFSGAQVRAGLKGPLSRSLIYSHRVETTDQQYLPEQKLDVLRALGIPCEKWSWNLKIPGDEAAWAENFFAENGIAPSQPVVGLAPATRRPIRAWKEDRFAEVAANLLMASNHVLFLWGPGEKELVERVNGLIKRPAGSKYKILVPPEIPLLKLAALIKKCSAVLGVDNGPKNMAVALGVPSVTLSGPTNPLSFDPHGDPLHPVLRDADLFCISCGLNQCPYKHECMENISTATASQALRKLLLNSMPAIV